MVSCLYRLDIDGSCTCSHTQVQRPFLMTAIGNYLHVYVIIMLVSASFYVTQGLRHIRIFESTFVLYPQTADDVELVDASNTTWSQTMKRGGVDNSGVIKKDLTSSILLVFSCQFISFLFFSGDSYLLTPRPSDVKHL